MKNAAKREMWCESQNIVNHRIFERTLRLLDEACLSERRLKPNGDVWVLVLGRRPPGRGLKGIGLVGG